MKHTLLIHMGVPKTGTTALQCFLYKNRRKLEEYGWCYPDLKMELLGEDGSKTGKNGNIFCIWKKFWAELREDNHAIWNQVQKYLEDRNVLLSAEELIRVADPFLEEAKEYCDKIKVVVYVRRQDRLVESVWNQFVKMGYDRTFREFIQCDLGMVKWIIPYAEKLETISKQIGRENLVVRVYEKQQFSGELHTITSDFLSVLGIEPDWGEWEDSVTYQNPSLQGNYLELKRIFNSVRASADIFGGGYPHDLLFTELSETFKEETEYGYFTVEERKNFLARFTAENEQIAKTYLHREDGILFYEDRMDYPQMQLRQAEDFQRDIIRLFSLMFCKQEERRQKEIWHLKCNNQILVEKMMLSQAKKRDVLLFGAGQKCREILKILRVVPMWIVDNNLEKRGKDLEGIEILHFTDIKEWPAYFTIITCVETKEIEEQLQMQGLKKEEDYVLAKEYME